MPSSSPPRTERGAAGRFPGLGRSFAPGTGHWPGLARALPFALLIAGIALDSLLGERAASLPWDPRWHYALRSLAALAALLALRRHLPELRWNGGAGQAGELGLGVLAGVAVFALWITPSLQAFALSAGGFDPRMLAGHTSALAGSGFQPLDAQGRMLPGLAAARLAGSALVVPLAEELFWRSLVMRSIDCSDFARHDPRRVSWRALGLQALVFGLEHDLWLAGALAGLAYGWLYHRTGRLWPAILAHGLTNGLLGAWVLTGSHWSYW